jgi:cell shape-determining protein MreD
MIARAFISLIILLILRGVFKIFSGQIFELYHVFIILLAFYTGYWEGFIFSLIAGYLIGSLSGIPCGEYAFSFPTLFTVTFMLKNVLNPENKWVWVLLPFIGTFLNFFSAGIIRLFSGLMYEVHYYLILNALISVVLLNFINFWWRRNVVSSS